MAGKSEEEKAKAVVVDGREAEEDEESEEEDEEEDNAWSDWEEDGGEGGSGGAVVTALFDGTTWPTVADAVKHTREAHGLDLAALIRRLALDDYGRIRLVNYLRSKTWTAAEIQQLQTEAGAKAAAAVFANDDAFLQPVLADDALLFGLDDIVEEAGTAAPADDAPAWLANLGLDAETRRALADATGVVPATAVRALAEAAREADARARAAAAEVVRLQRLLASYSELAATSLLQQTGLDTRDRLLEVIDDPVAPVGDDKAAGMDYYFASYSNHHIHEEMLKDDIRTLGYEYFMSENSDLFKDKVVLDIGCGTGILCMFAAKAGAKQVIGIDAATIATQARANIAENGFADRVTIINAKVEEATLPVSHVDIIVSEWMGYFLLYESMLDTVLYARDKWLVPGGHVFPQYCTLFIAGVQDDYFERHKLGYWSNVYGLKMNAMKPLVFPEPTVAVVPEDILATTAHAFKRVAAETITVAELEFGAPFEVVAERAHRLNGFVTYFDVDFGGMEVRKPTTFTTGPQGTPTHWKQTLLYLEHPQEVAAGARITGTLHVAKNAGNPRAVDVRLSFAVDGSAVTTQLYHLL